MNESIRCRECNSVNSPGAAECPECGLPAPAPVASGAPAEGPARPAPDAVHKPHEHKPAGSAPRGTDAPRTISRGARNAIIGVFAAVTVVALFLVYLKQQKPAGSEAGADARAENGRVTADALGGASGDTTPLSVLKQAVEKQPNNPSHLLGMANALYDAGHFDQAAPYYRRALALDPSKDDARVDLATCLYQTGKHDLALAELDSVLASGASHPNAIYNRGVILHVMGREAEAKAAWQDYLKVQPNGPHTAEVKALIAGKKLP